MHSNPERVAWTVLLSAFFAFCALVTLVPVSTAWWVQNATAAQTILISSSGAVNVTRPGGRLPERMPEDRSEEIPVGSVIVTDQNARADLTFISGGLQEVLATVRVYGVSRVEIVQAEMPRYAWGDKPNAIEVRLESGRVQVNVGLDTARPVRTRILSEPGVVTSLVRPGTYVSLEAHTKTIVTVREGAAFVTSQNLACTVTRDARAEASLEAPLNCPLPAERNLIVNGDFQQDLSVGWAVDAVQQSDPNDDPGRVEPIASEGRRALHLWRPGRNWGQIGVTQELNQNVQGFTSLRLHLEILVSAQDLWICGAQGTECPVMVKLRYEDTGGGQREWVKGFFSNSRYTTDRSIAPEDCRSCPAPSGGPHEGLDVNQWQTFDFDLLASLQDYAPSFIYSISIYGAGHTFDGQIRDIQLLASE